MAEHHISDVYSQSFATFLEHTDEKAVFLKELQRRIAQSKYSSLLDIGAGNGDLAVPISRLVNKYVAVELKPDYAAKLRQAGLAVIEGPFTSEVVSEVFELVLMSHVLPWREEGYLPLIEAAWRCVGDGGELLVITYDDEQSEWTRFLTRSGLLQKTDKHRLDDLRQVFQRLGTLNAPRITTHVRTATAEKMLQALAFVFSDGREEKLQRFMEHPTVLLELEAYRTAEGYEFPFDHVFFSTRRA